MVFMTSIFYGELIISEAKLVREGRF